jgi:hypothetical protein
MSNPKRKNTNGGGRKGNQVEHRSTNPRGGDDNVDDQSAATVRIAPYL